MSDVCLVYLPYGPLERPSLAFGILSSVLKQNDIDHCVRYANFGFAERIGLFSYANLASVRQEMVGEWTFAGIAFPEFSPDHESYLDAVAAIHQSEQPEGDVESIKSNLWKVRRLAEEYIRDLAVRVSAEKPRIVACTSSFNQNCSMLGFIRLIKKLDPEVVTIVGGANCEGEMGYTMARHFPWLDYVVSGEGEELFPGLCREILAGRKPDPLPYGVFGEQTRKEQFRRPSAAVDRASIKDLNQSPTPDFSAYFDALDRYQDQDGVKPGLLIETARGCWWGEKQHCTFCGLNGGGMTFRSKSADRIIQEFQDLAERYGVHRFLVVDNILSMRAFNDVLPALAASPLRLEMLFEIKANIQLHQLETLRAAGGTWLQPGIEALHDDLLDLMKKGTKTWINVQTLKWARSLGQHVSWNLLCGFPGERDEWFAEVAQWISLIEHLQPPKDVRLIRFDRFSPYQARPAEFGLSLRPGWPHRFIYPLGEEDLSGLVYVFEETDRPDQRSSIFTLADRDELPSLGAPGRDALQLKVRNWNNSFMSSLPPILCMTEDDDRTFVYDTRSVAPQRVVRLDGLLHRVHRQLDSTRTISSLVTAVNSDGTVAASEEDIQAALGDLIVRKLILCLGDRYLALAVRGEMPSLPKQNQDGYPGGWIKRPRRKLSSGYQMPRVQDSVVLRN